MLRITLALVVVSLAASACTSSAPAPAPTPRTSSVPRSAPPPAPTATATVTFTFTANDASRVRAYYDGHSRGNGRGRNGGLPPGIEKNLARGKPLPPGIAKQHLPADLVVQISAPPRGMEYVVVAGKLLLVEVATQIVREILLEAVFG